MAVEKNPWKNLIKNYPALTVDSLYMCRDPRLGLRCTVHECYSTVPRSAS